MIDFIQWIKASGGPVVNKASVQHYAAQLHEQGVGASSINQRLSAVRKLATEAADNGFLPEAVANGIRHVQGVRQSGQRSGNWLIRQQAEQLMAAPGVTTLKGLRDRALLAVLIGCGLRREELVHLTFEHVQQRDGRWVIVDIVGKRNRVRSVPMPPWTKVLIDSWSRAAGLNEGHIFRSMNKGDKIIGQRTTTQAIWRAVQKYTRMISLSAAPHDLRRTFAKLAHRGGSPIDQIQLSLGHSSVQTTERYLGVEQDLVDAPCDHLGLKVELNG
ncbi:MAG: tyrosine-type recombinase/integrase [Gammaproteobacteria bacterium]|nr:tyrosine-type recombinase/integrase [Gammaproteobacteria bacterium]